jgi:hypothetical protein
MKKRELNALTLNRKSISNLNSTATIMGGASYRATCGCVTDSCNQTFTCVEYGCPNQK